MPKAIIIGGGIGGLAAAKALLNIGHEVEVYERAPMLEEVGAGIGLWYNGLDALDNLGIDNYKTCSLASNETCVRSAEGKVLSCLSLEEIKGARHDLVRFFHRAELLECLENALPASILHPGKQCTGYTEAHDNVAVRFQDGSVARGTYLIGADGIHSAVRSQLKGKHNPRFAGYTAWRSIIPFDGSLRYGEFWGKGARFGIFPLKDNRIYWFATQSTSQGQRAPFGERAHLVELFNRWYAPISSVVESTVESEILRNDVIDRPPNSQWGKGLVTLLGDAAHAMTPNMGQGACQALEDAVALREAFEAENYVEPALRRYENSRRKRANWFVKQSQLIGKIAQAQTKPAMWLRNTMAKRTPDFLRKQQFYKMLNIVS